MYNRGLNLHFKEKERQKTLRSKLKRKNQKSSKQRTFKSNQMHLKESLKNPCYIDYQHDLELIQLVDHIEHQRGKVFQIEFSLDPNDSFCEMSVHQQTAEELEIIQEQMKSGEAECAGTIECNIF